MMTSITDRESQTRFQISRLIILFSIGTAVDLIYLARTVHQVWQSKENVLSEYISVNDNCLDRLEILFTCCGVIAQDSIIKYPTLNNEVCRPEKGFTSKAHPYCNYVVGEYIMKADSAMVALGFLTSIFLTISLYQRASRYSVQLQELTIKSNLNLQNCRYRTISTKINSVDNFTTI